MAKQPTTEAIEEKTVGEEVADLASDVRSFIERAKEVTKNVSKEEIGVFIGLAVLELAAAISRSTPVEEEEDEEEDDEVYGG